MSKPVIPPLPSGTPTGQTVEVLEQRLMAAEHDTRDLISRLSEMGFDKAAPHREAPGLSQETPSRDLYTDDPALQALKSRVLDTEQLRSNYEALVSRVCRTESAIQTMKLSMLNFQGSKDVKKKIYAQVEEKWTAAKQNYESQLSYLKREVRGLQDELTSECEARAKLKEETKTLQNALDEANTNKAEATVRVDDLTTSKQKMIRRISELKEELSMESSLRSSLEDSHNTLLDRIREMENVVETERSEVQALTSSCKGLKTEVLHLTGQLSQEQKARQHVEDRWNELCIIRDKLESDLSVAESDSRIACTELSRFRTQYQDLILQVEKTKTLIDDHKSRCKDLDCENQRLACQLDTTTNELERLRNIQKREFQVEKTHVEERVALEEETSRLRSCVRKTHTENDDLKSKVDTLERELKKMRQEVNAKEKEFAGAAGGLERELNSLRTQLHSMQDEKQRVLQDKENLLEEVNQTVDTLMEERVALQSDLDQTKMELQTLYDTQRKVEREKAELLDRMSGFEQQQVTQKKVQSTLKEMMEQKNKLAYDNGRLQTLVNHLQDDLDNTNRDFVEGNHLKKVNQALQAKYSSAQKEISELKVAIQCLQNQHKLSRELIDEKDHQLKSVVLTREQLEKDMTKLASQLQAMDDRDRHKGASYQKNLDSAKTVNREIASTLEAVMSSHSQLQTLVENLQIELGKRDTQISQLRSEKNKNQQEMRLEMKTFESKMSALRDELKKEREKSVKKNTKELAELKKQNDNLSSRNMDLVKSNSDLRHRMNEAERSITELTQKLTDQKRRMEYLHKAKKHLEENLAHMKVVRQDIDDLERMRDEYIKRNEAQGETIQVFVAQIASLQNEIKQLAQAQANTSNLLIQKEVALEKEKVIRDEMKKKYHETKKREEAVSKKKKDAEGKLKEAHTESLEISQHLQQAHDWFKTKFDKLQTELDLSKKTQVKLEEENTSQRLQLESERYRAQDAAERAKEMIKASRETISRLADYTEQAEYDTKSHMARLKADLDTEKEVNKYVEMKHQKYKEENNRHLDELMNMLDSASTEEYSWLDQL